MDKILKTLKALHVSEYRLVERKTNGKEWFFIGKKLDMSRAKEVTDYYLTIYQTVYETDKRYKGQATAKISPQLDEDDLEDVICQLVKEASYVRNPYFDLPSFMYDIDETFAPLGDEQDIFQMMWDFYESDTLSLNSYEFFETIEEVRIVNSKGLDVSYIRPTHELELIINAKSESSEIEYYQDLRFGQANIADLKHQIGEACRQAEERKNAVSTPEMTNDVNVILTKENVISLMRYYLMQLNTSYIYNKYSSCEIGTPIGPNYFNIEGIAYLENSSLNHVYDQDGRAVQNVSLIENGIAKALWGAHDTSSYLGLYDTTMIYNYKVSGGKVSLDEMKSKPYLELVQFSSFSCNPITGSFSGEIRLGYYFDGEKTITVTGGSISGNIKDNEATMQLSKDLVKYNNAVVPSAVLLKNVNIAI